MDFELVDVVQDEGISGQTMSRPGMNRIQEMIEAGEIGAVITYKLGRLSRKTIDILNTLDAGEKNDIAFHSIMDKINTKTAAGNFPCTILFSPGADGERSYLRKNHGFIISQTEIWRMVRPDPVRISYRGGPSCRR